ncbi:MAG: helix-turn-helix domain-containing protein [Blastocatellia bacterium]
MILSRGSDLEVPLTELKKRGSHSSAGGAANPATLADAEREHILRALQETNWVISGSNGAAAQLGLKRTTLNTRMRKLGIKRPTTGEPSSR